MAVTNIYSGLYVAGSRVPNTVFDMENGGSIATSLTIPTTQLDDIGDVSWLIPVPLSRPLTSVTVGMTVIADTGGGGATLDPDLVYRIEKTDGTFDDTILINSSDLSNVLRGALTTHRTFILGDTSQYGGKRVTHADARYHYAHLVYKIVAAANAAQETVLTLEARFR